MAMPKYRIITPVDQAVAEKWISRHLPELPSQAGKIYRCYPSSPAVEMLNILNTFVERWLDEDQRRRLHTSIRQARMRQERRKKKLDEVTITFCGETVTRLNDLVSWQPGSKKRISRTKYLELLIDQKWADDRARQKWLHEIEHKEREENRV